jgi:hypothetical protein
MKMTLLLRVLFVVVCLLGITAIPSFARTGAAPWAGAAQTHPCDQAAPTTVTVLSGAPHKVQMCLPQSANAEAVLAVVDAVPFDLVPIVARTGPSATGQVLYESGAFVQVSRGQHTLTLRAYNRNALTGQMQLGEASAPFNFTAVDDTPVPAAPKILNVIR